MIIDQETLNEARAAAKNAEAVEPLLSGHRRKLLEAVAYFIVSEKKGVKMSMYDAEELFGVADTPFRRCYRLMAPLLGFSLEPYRRKRSRNAYDIYAEILQDEGESLTGYIRRIHLTHSELRKHLTFLREHGLITADADQGRETFSLTEKGRQYLEIYEKLASVLGGRPE
jgi:predicted transcriptional regulator